MDLKRLTLKSRHLSNFCHLHMQIVRTWMRSKKVRLGNKFIFLDANAFR